MKPSIDGLKQPFDPAMARVTEARALAVRMFSACLSAAELTAAYLGVRLGLYRVLSDGSPESAPHLAERAGIAPRYAREWLEQQAACGILGVDDPSKAADERLYTLPLGHADVLANAENPLYAVPLALLPIGGIGRVLPLLLDAFRSGNGVPYAEYGEDFCEGKAALNRNSLIGELERWIEIASPTVHRRMRAGGARVADIACGTGWSSIAMAQAYPDACIEGFDRDERSVRHARENAQRAGVQDRVSFSLCEVAELDSTSRYDLVYVVDALHDMARPVEVLRICRALRGEHGTVLLVEPRAAESFSPPTGEIERFLYAVSVLHCLPVGSAEKPSAQTGTVMRPATLRRYARDAGFREVRILPVEHRFYRVYSLVG